MLDCRKVAVLCHTGSALRDECIEEDGTSGKGNLQMIKKLCILY
jgi:hypothetical protein